MAALASQAHQPFAQRIPQARPQVDASWIGAREQAGVGHEVVAGAEGQAGVGARSKAADSGTDAILEVVGRAHRGVATCSSMASIRRSAMAARLSSYTGVKKIRCTNAEGITDRTSSGVR